MTVSPLVALPEPSYPTLVVWDFNIYYPVTDPLGCYSTEELVTSIFYFSRSSELRFAVLNQHGVYTRFPLRGSGRSSVLCLSFTSPFLLPFCQAWDTPLPSTGSDPVPDQITLFHPFSSSPSPSPNWALTNWPARKPLLKDFAVPHPPSLPTWPSLDAWFDSHLTCLTALLISHTPMKRSFYL